MRVDNIEGETKNMKHNTISTFSSIGVASVGTAVLGLTLVFFFGGEGYDIAFGQTTDSTSSAISTTAPPLTTSTPNTTVTTDTESPSKPSGLSAVVQNGKVALSWNSSSDNVGVSGYALYRNGSFMVTVTGTSFLDTGVQPGSSYQYAVKAGDFSGNKSELSSTVSATIPTATLSTTTAPTTTTTAPLTTTTAPLSTTTVSPTVSITHTLSGHPENLSVKILDNRTVRIEWSAPSGTTGIVGYRLFRNNAILGSVTGTTFIDRSVYGGQEYRYSVVAFDTVGNTSQRSEEKKVIMPLVTVQTGSTTTNTTWTAENNGNTLVVRNSDGEVVPGQTIVNQGGVTQVLMDDTAKENAAKAALKEAMQSGFIPADKGDIPTDTLTPEDLTRLPESQNLDFDHDGLSNVDELRMGSDPYSKDTDQDGFGDGDEVQSGHDPKRFSPGDGRDKMAIEDVRGVITTERAKPVDQDTKKDDRYQVKNVELVKSSSPDAKPVVRLSGVALPNAMVTLYIYSTPTIVTVKADALGNWSYDVNQDLENGNHEAFVAVTDNTGKVTAYGEGIGFVKTAEAVTVRPIAEAAETVSENQSPLERSQMEYFFAAFIAILFFSGAALIVVSRKSSGPIVS